MSKFFCSIFVLVFTIKSSFGQIRVALETGAVWNQYNDVRAPNTAQSKGTLFSFTEDFSPREPRAFFRLQGSYAHNFRHIFELTAAPLELGYDLESIKPITFEDFTFDLGTVSGEYQFNTYRGSYRYRLYDRRMWRLELGATVLIRDARIQLFQNDNFRKNTDLGVVPLVSFRFEAGRNEGLQFLFSGDALVGPQGRAEDIFIGVTLPIISDPFYLKLGYRLIEGGADVEQVYNFSFFHFANVSLVAKI